VLCQLSYLGRLRECQKTKRAGESAAGVWHRQQQIRLIPKKAMDPP
jgi:hypothetical protein